MIEEVLPNLFRIEIPVPQNPLRVVNTYLVKGSGQFLLVDTGMNRDECINEMRLALTKLSVDLSKTSFLITHWHVDHLGMVTSLASDRSVIYFNRPESIGMDPAVLMANKQENATLAKLSGFPAHEVERATTNHPGYRYGPRGKVNFSVLRDGDTLTIGDYLFQCVETPGHSPGHLCLYEPKKRLLLSGDHILVDITPNIAFWSNTANPLSQYLASLDKVYALEVDLVLPGHRTIITDCRARIKELKQHHETRSREILSILERGRQTAYQTAAQMSWDLEYESWRQFPVLQKWFATGEAISHLKYLEDRGLVNSETNGHEIVFRLTG